MTEEKNETNRRIFEWLNPDGCWHEPAMITKPDFCWRCLKCKREVAASCVLDNPDYHSESGFFLLLKGLEEKGYIWKGGMAVADENLGYWSELLGTNGKVVFCADTLPAALCAAAVKLIEEKHNG